MCTHPLLRSYSPGGGGGLRPSILSISSLFVQKKIGYLVVIRRRTRNGGKQRFMWNWKEWPAQRETPPHFKKLCRASRGNFSIVVVTPSQQLNKITLTRCWIYNAVHNNGEILTRWPATSHTTAESPRWPILFRVQNAYISFTLMRDVTNGQRITDQLAETLGQHPVC